MKKLFIIIIALLCIYGCNEIASVRESNSGVQQSQVTIKTQADGRTIEQQNIANRLLMDNKVGSIKHFYVISAYSGQVLIYSTVNGKVTSSGKRLSPTEQAKKGDYIETYYPELLQDDGTYGSSVEYLYWWDTKGIYHQHYVSGGQIVHISDQPIAVKNIVINMEMGLSN